MWRPKRHLQSLRVGPGDPKAQRLCHPLGRFRGPVEPDVSPWDYLRDYPRDNSRWLRTPRSHRPQESLRELETRPASQGNPGERTVRSAMTSVSCPRVCPPPSHLVPRSFVKRSSQPNKSEPSNGAAAGFGATSTGEFITVILGRSVERPPDHLSRYSLRSLPAPREEAMSQTDSKPALSPEQQAAVEAIRGSPIEASEPRPRRADRPGGTR